MSSVRAQILAAVKGKLDTVLSDLDWATVLENPREPVGEDQLNAIVLMHGGDRDPADLTDHVELNVLEFSVAWMAREANGATAEALLDTGFVAISDALLDPADIQLGGLAIGIRRTSMSDPLIGRGQAGARILCGQSMEFEVQYMTREGNASTPGP